MRRTLMILSLLAAATFFTGCGEKSTTTTNANTQSNVTGTGNRGTGGTAGIGPENQGIGGNANQGPVNGNTYTVPPGFNSNGDTGSATRNRNAP